MSGITDLRQLLADLRPVLDEAEYVFCSIESGLAEFLDMEPVAVVSEPEGTTLVLEKGRAQQRGFDAEIRFRRITLMVHSSLEAVGLTAAVANQLASAGISANIIAGYHHDHVFVPADKAHAADRLLQELGS